MGLQFDAKTGLPLQLYCGAWEKPAGHLQGIAMDDEGRYMYYSFTDRLIKADMRTGEIVGSVTGLLAGGIYGGGAHMGCLAYHDGKVYGSLEYKAAEKFYVAVFDCAAITRMDMDYKTLGVMTAMYMDEVVRDYVCDLSAGEHNNAPDSMGHRFGCSGIDGITFGPVPGEADKGVRMLLSYGIYSNPQRQDNDYQVLLAFDPKDFAAEPFDQNHPHTVGPRLDRKFFVYTGNTTYGVQNLEYDRDTGDYWMIVYEGKKPQFPNGPVYLVDGAAAPCGRRCDWGTIPNMPACAARCLPSGTRACCMRQAACGTCPTAPIRPIRALSPWGRIPSTPPPMPSSRISRRAPCVCCISIVRITALPLSMVLKIKGRHDIIRCVNR